MKKQNLFEALMPIVIGVLFFIFARLAWQGNGKWDKPGAIVLFIGSVMGVFGGVYDLFETFKNKR